MLLPVYYRGIQLDCGYRLDLLVEASIIIEVKAVAKVLPVHRAQVLTYLKLADLRIGLLINSMLMYCVTESIASSAPVNHPKPS